MLDVDAREAYLRRVVDSIPPLTPEQRERITALLSGPAVGSSGEGPETRAGAEAA